MTKSFLPRILETKAAEVAQLTEQAVPPVRQTYKFYDHLKANSSKLHVIAEVKKASPSLGDINLSVDIVQQAKTYEASGASMISVLTDETYFKGAMADLRAVSEAVTIPTLNKDFIIDERQIQRAVAAGATVILLIVAALSEDRLKELYDYTYRLGLEVLVETHDARELAVAHRIGAQIIGVNNRNLVTFETDLQTSLDLSKDFIDGPVYVSESAIFTGQDAARLAPHFQAILVGTALMTATDVAQTMEELQIDKG